MPDPRECLIVSYDTMDDARRMIYAPVEK